MERTDEAEKKTKFEKRSQGNGGEERLTGLAVTVTEVNEEEMEIVNGILILKREIDMAGNLYLAKKNAINFIPFKNIMETNNLIKTDACYVSDKMV